MMQFRTYVFCGGIAAISNGINSCCPGKMESCLALHTSYSVALSVVLTGALYCLIVAGLVQRRVKSQSLDKELLYVLLLYPHIMWWLVAPCNGIVTLVWWIILLDGPTCHCYCPPLMAYSLFTTSSSLSAWPLLARHQLGCSLSAWPLSAEPSARHQLSCSLSAWSLLA
jgi:hypothetical protein